MARRRVVCMVVTALFVVGCGEIPVEPEVALQAATGSATPLIVSTSERIPLPPPPGYTFPHPRHVNRRGQVAGSAVALNPRRDVGVLWQDGTPIELSGLPGNPVGIPRAINDTGKLLGSAAPAGGGAAVPAAWRDGIVTSLSDLTGDDLFFGLDINNAGWIAGFLGVSPRIGAIWAMGQGVTALPTPVGYGNTFARRVDAGLILGEADRLVEHPSGPPTHEDAFVIWDQEGAILWTHDGDPRPLSGGALWVGITSKGDAYIRNRVGGGLWRWRDGELAPWPNPSDPEAANAMAVSRSGLVLGGLMENSAYTTLGVWKRDRFYAFDDQDMWCIDISDVYVLCGQGERGGFSIANPFIAKLSFEDPSE